MFTKLFFLTLLFTGLHLVIVAQRVYDREIACNDVGGFDSIIFFQPLKPDELIETYDWSNTNLYGSYFDKFPQVRLELLSALKFYPELVNVKIKFKYKSIKQTMNSRPSPVNVFKSKANRRYTILVNDNQGKVKGLDFEKLSFNIKVGWIGHELAHICEYESSGNWGIFCFALRYVTSKDYVRKVERNTDLITIQHGLAFQLYDGIEFITANDDISEKYRIYARANSLTLAEIRCFWCQYRLK